jgi:hypothetical protein
MSARYNPISALRHAIEERRMLQGANTNDERSKLARNEQLMRRLATLCQTCPLPERFKVRTLIVESLVESSHLSPSLVEAVSAAFPTGVTNYAINRKGLAMEVRETLIRLFRGDRLLITPDLDEETAIMMVRAADANRRIQKLDLRGTSPRTIAEIGETMTLAEVSLMCGTGNCNLTQIASQEELNIAVTNMVRKNRTIKLIALHGAFDSSICAGISTDNTSLKGLEFHDLKPDDDLHEMKDMLKRNNSLRFLRMHGVSDISAASLAEGLAGNRGLHTLCCTASKGLTPTGVDALIETMASSNTTLRYAFGDLDARLAHYCALNRAGRGAMRRSDFPQKHFLAALQESRIDNASVLYGLLRDSPHCWSA